MANYKKAPKLYHIGKKDGDKKNFIKIPQDLMESIFNQLNGRQGNVIKVILFLIGTVGDGSFGVSERWMCDSTGMLKSCYIEARKTLVELGWVEVIAGRININFDKIRNINGSCEATLNEARVVLNEKRVALNDDMGRVNLKNGLCDTNCNKEEQIINKEITIEEEPKQENINTNVKISRTRDLEYILDLYNLTETDIIKIIQNNNIENADDFVHLLYYETNNINISCGRNILDIQDVVLDYHKYHDYNKFQIGDEFKQDDILTYASKDQSSRVLRWFFKYYNSSVKIETNEQVEILYKIIEDGAKMSTYYFVRNSKRD